MDLQVLRNDLCSSGASADILSTVKSLEDASDVAVDILNDLLLFDKLDSGILKLDLTSVPVKQFLIETLQVRLQISDNLLSSFPNLILPCALFHHRWFVIRLPTVLSSLRMVDKLKSTVNFLRRVMVALVDEVWRPKNTQNQCHRHRSWYIKSKMQAAICTLCIHLTQMLSRSVRNGCSQRSFNSIQRSFRRAVDRDWDFTVRNVAKYVNQLMAFLSMQFVSI